MEQVHVKVYRFQCMRIQSNDYTYFKMVSCTVNMWRKLVLCRNLIYSYRHRLWTYWAFTRDCINFWLHWQTFETTSLFSFVWSSPLLNSTNICEKKKKKKRWCWCGNRSEYQQNERLNVNCTKTGIFLVRIALFLHTRQCLDTKPS